MRKVMVIAAAAVLLGCGDQVAKNAVKRLLNDPDSAKFSNIQPGKATGDYCGFVNAKNRMGGYVGDTPFFYRKDTDTVAIVTSPDDGDFRGLWLAIRSSSSFTSDLAKLSQKCGLMDQWDNVCSTPHPQQKHRLCAAVQGDGAAMYRMLEAEYGRR